MLLMTERKRKPSEAEPSEFGLILLTLMRKHGTRSAAALSRRLDADGYPISQQMISKYINDQSKVPLPFVSQVIATLNLDDDEQSALADKWALTLPENERNVIMRVWEIQRPAHENIEAAKRIEAEEEKGDRSSHGSEGQAT